MSKLADCYPGRHPSTPALDALRAGLLDRHPDRRASIAAHLETCSACRQRAAIVPRIVDTLDRQTLDSRTAAQLAARRRQALQGTSRRRARPAYFGLAVAASLVAIAIGIGTVFLNTKQEPAPAMATAEAPSPDLYADLDFYLWLMHKNANETKLPNG